MKNIFTRHPHSVGESYFQHCKFALSFGLKMIIGGAACLIHAIFPFFFQKTGSDILIKLIHFFIERTPKIESRIELLAQLIKNKQTNQ